MTGEFAEDMVGSFHRALLRGVEGVFDDVVVFMSPWGFDLDEISIPTIIWQGSEDLMVPYSHGQWLAAHPPNAAVHLEQGEGHLSIALGALDRMFDELVAVPGWR